MLLDMVLDFDGELLYYCGKLNIVVDTLSRE